MRDNSPPQGMPQELITAMRHARAWFLRNTRNKPPQPFVPPPEPTVIVNHAYCAIVPGMNVTVNGQQFTVTAVQRTRDPQLDRLAIRD